MTAVLSKKYCNSVKISDTLRTVPESRDHAKPLKQPSQFWDYLNVRLICISEISNLALLCWRRKCSPFGLPNCINHSVIIMFICKKHVLCLRLKFKSRGLPIGRDLLILNWIWFSSLCDMIPANIILLLYEETCTYGEFNIMNSFEF